MYDIVIFWYLASLAYDGNYIHVYILFTLFIKLCVEIAWSHCEGQIKNVGMRTR